MDESSFVSSDRYAFDLTDKSGYQYPYVSDPTPRHRRRFRSNSMHSMLHHTNRSQAWPIGENRELLPFVSKSVHLRECFAEFLGTLVLVCFGVGVNNQVVLSANANGTWLSINICWGIGVLIGVYVAEGVSGAHLNTAVTFAHAVFGRIPWWKVPGYAFAQTFGAFCAAALIYVLQYQRLMLEDPNQETMQANFATYPSEGVSTLTAFFTEALATGVLLLAIYAITDEKNRAAGPVGTPFAFALLFMGLGMAFGTNTGYAVNPARDLGPRLFTLMAGYGTKVFTASAYYFWIPIVGPIAGGVMGAGTYVFFVQAQHANED